jgi:hypothetical protein
MRFLQVVSVIAGQRWTQGEHMWWAYGSGLRSTPQGSHCVHPPLLNKGKPKRYDHAISEWVVIG